MNRLICIALFSSLVIACASAPKDDPAAVSTAMKPTPMAEKWNVTEKIDTPESAYFDVATASIFVANVAGQPNGKDKKGWISRLGQDGSVQNAEFAKGFNAPKGLRSHKGTLWLTDIDEVVSIDINSAKVSKRYKVQGAKFLNDIAIADDGTVYVSDMVVSRIHMVKDGKVSVFADGAQLEHPNGLLVDGGKLIVAAWGAGMKPDFSTATPGNLYSIDLKTKEKTNITRQPLGALDGLEKLPNGNYVVSDWMAGKVYSVSSDGTATMLLEGFKGSADLGVVPGANLLIVPRMGENRVTAYGIQ